MLHSKHENGCSWPHYLAFAPCKHTIAHTSQLDTHMYLQPATKQDKEGYKGCDDTDCINYIKNAPQAAAPCIYRDQSRLDY
eukprot:1157374-Pelagomonas_calceolata.AAC.1